MDDAKRYALITALVATYTVTSAAEVVGIKALNYDHEFRLPLYCAMMMNAYWPIQGLMYWWTKRTREPTRKITPRQLKGFVTIGCLAAGVTALRSFGVNALPGSAYVILATADGMFIVLLTRLIFPKRRFTPFHYIAVMLAGAAIAVVALEKQEAEPTELCDGADCVDDYVAGICAALGSALLSATNSILGDFLLVGPDGKKPKKNIIAVQEVSFFNSFMASLFLPIILLASSEAPLWPQSFDFVSAKGATGAVVGLSILLGIAKMLDRLSKFQIIALKHAFFFVLVDTIRRMLTAVFLILVFDEAPTWNKFVGLFLSCAGVLVYGYGSYLNKKLEQAEQAAKEAEAGEGGGSGVRRTSETEMVSTSAGAKQRADSNGSSTSTRNPIDTAKAKARGSASPATATNPLTAAEP